MKVLKITFLKNNSIRSILIKYQGRIETVYNNRANILTGQYTYNNSFMAHNISIKKIL